MISVLKKLVNATGISGREAQVRDLIKEEIAPYVDGMETDAMGNLIAHKKGNGKKLLFAAHTDSIGFFVTFIEKNGAIRVSPVGDIDFLAAMSEKPSAGMSQHWRRRRASGRRC